MRRTNLLRIVCQIAGLMLLVAAVASPTKSQTPTLVIAGNLGSGGTFQTGTGTAWATGPNAPPCNGGPCDPANAVGFTVPIGGPHYALTQFKFAANWSSGTNSVTVGLYMFRGPNTTASINSATQVVNPQTTVLESFTFSAATQGVAQLFTQTLNQPILLIPGNTYFLEMTESNAGTDWGWQWNDTGHNGYYAEFLPCGGVSPCWFAETATTPAFEADGITINTPVFASTRQGGQILVVDGDNPGTVAVVSGGGCDPCIQPEGIVVGPDNKIYIADPTNVKMYRMDQSSANFETLPSCTGSPCPFTPQAPVFSSSPVGDLYFSDPGIESTNDIFKIAGAAAVPVGGTFSNPTVVIPATATGTDLLGPGTAFDASDNLLFDDIKNNTVWSSPPPYSSVSSVATVTNPGAIALNKSTGQAFVANSAGQILPVGSSTPYFTFASPDIPQYMQFDATGRLFVATTQSPTTSPYHGKVWRIDPTVEGATATLLVDLNAFWANGDNSLGLLSDQADGIALPPAPYPAISILLNPAGGTNRYIFANGLFDYKVVYGPLAAPPPNPVSLVVQAFQESQQDLDAFTTGTPFSGATLAPYAGTGGYGIRFVATCQDVTGTIPCPAFQNPYDVFTNYNGTLPANTAFLKGPAGPFPYQANILTFASATRTNDPTVGGRSSPSFSGFQVVGNVTGTPPTVTITSPTNGATYILNQSVLANYTCVGAFVTGCLGNVPSGAAVDTSSVGTKTFTVTAVVSAGPTAAASSSYTVTSYQFIGFSSPVSNTGLNIANAGRTIPIKFQVLDANGNPVLNLTSPPVSLQSVQVNCTGFATLPAATVDATPTGQSGFQNLGGGFYQFNWATLNVWAGTCRQLQVTLGDGVLHKADFKFK